MTTRSEEPQTEELIHVHVCIGCGRVSQRDDPDGIPDVMGIYRCSLCGHEGPLNVHVIPRSDPRLIVTP